MTEKDDKKISKRRRMAYATLLVFLLMGTYVAYDYMEHKRETQELGIIVVLRDAEGNAYEWQEPSVWEQIKDKLSFLSFGEESWEVSSTPITQIDVYAYLQMSPKTLQVLDWTYDYRCLVAMDDAGTYDLIDASDYYYALSESGYFEDWHGDRNISENCRVDEDSNSYWDTVDEGWDTGVDCLRLASGSLSGYATDSTHVFIPLQFDIEESSYSYQSMSLYPVTIDLQYTQNATDLKTGAGFYDGLELTMTFSFACKITDDATPTPNTTTKTGTVEVDITYYNGMEYTVNDITITVKDTSATS